MHWKKLTYTMRSPCTALSFLVVLCLQAVFTKPVSASGQEFAMREHDLVVNVDTRWAGGAQGGYYPIRIRLVNRGRSRTLTFRFASEHEKMPTVLRREVAADQNATVQFTLPVPLVGSGSSGMLTIEENGRPLKGMSTSIRLPQFDVGAMSRPSLLVISPVYVDSSYFDAAVQSIPGSSSYGRSSTHSDIQVVPPTLLPDSWIDYTTVDLVAVGLPTLQALDPAKRVALLNWVDCGGTLIVYDVGEPAGKSKPLNGLLEIDNSATASSPWTAANPAVRNTLPGTTVQVDGEEVMQQLGEAVVESFVSGQNPVETLSGRLQENLSGRPVGRQGQVPWTVNPETFAKRERLLGLVVAFPENPFPGSARDWNWLLNSIGPTRYVWTTRNGVSARTNSGEFREFLIPDVKGVPVYSFLTLMTLFTIVIGPLNYFVLRRRKQLYLLILTIPLIAFFTSLSLFGYSVVAHGFGVKSRIRSLTVLDQKSNTAVTTSRVALFAGLAPSEGLQYSPDTAVFPIWPPNVNFESGVVDWTREQALESGWLRSRTRTQLYTVSHRPERQRIDVGAPQNGQLTVSNGFEWDIEAIVVADGSGAPFVGRNLSAGGSARLNGATEEELKEIVELLKLHSPKPPEEISGGRSELEDIFRWDRSYYRNNEQNLANDIRFSRSLMEETISSMRTKLTRGENFAGNTYLAIFRENPGINPGLEQTDEQIGYHVLIGYY